MDNDNRPNVAGAVIDVLVGLGIDQLYCLPGVQNDDFFNVLFDRQSEVHPIQVRHEQGAAYMALGAALATGKPQAFCVVPGPGLLNAAAALSTALAVNAPVFALVGQIPGPAIGKSFGFLHEIPDQTGIIERLTRQTHAIRSGADAVSKLNAAARAFLSGRPGPIAVEIPVDVWMQPVEPDDEDSLHPPHSSKGLEEEVSAAIALIDEAKKPLIIVGGGAQHASANVVKLCEKIGAPVAANRTGKGVVSSRHDRSISSPVAHALWSDCDLVLALGTRLQKQQMMWGVDGDLKIIHVDIDPLVPGMIQTPTLAVCADVDVFVRNLLDRVGHHGANCQDWLSEVAEIKMLVQGKVEKRLEPQLAWLSAIRKALPDDGIFVEELTQMGYVARHAFPVYKPRTYLTPGYQGTLGWGIATALGAAHARPDVPVVSISGDGGAMFTIAELATAVQHKIPVTIVIFSDNAFGNIKRFQIEKFGERTIASDLVNPDFVRLGESFGITARQVETVDEFSDALEEAIGSEEPRIVVVPVGDFPSPWEFEFLPKVRGN